MSRLYSMSIKIMDYDDSKTRAIFDAIKHEWEIDHEYCHGVSTDEEEPRFLSASGESYLCGGESEEEFADRIALAIWKANGGCCHIEVIATFLEELPYEIHTRDEEDYHHLVEAERK